MKKTLVALMILMVTFTYSYVIGQFNGMCPYVDEEGYSLKNSSVVAGFDRNGRLINFALLENYFDAIGIVELNIDKKKFTAERVESSENELVVFGKAGEKNAKVVYKLDGKKIDIKAYSEGIRFLRVLVTPCAFSPVIIREKGRSYVQGRNVAYGIVSEGAVSIYSAGRLIIASRKVKENESGKYMEVSFYIAKDISELRQAIEGKEKKNVYRVFYSDGKVADGVKIVLKDNDKVVDVATSDKEGFVRFSMDAENPSFETVYTYEIEVKSVENGKLYLNVSSDKGYRWKPYLSNLGYDHVTVNLRTWAVCEAFVEVNGKRYTDKVKDTFHSITVTGLENGKEYEGVVVACGKKNKVKFKTFGYKNFKFLVYGDTRTNEDWHKLVADAMAKENALFVLHSGDLVESGDLIVDWDKFFWATSKLYSKSAFFPSLGNHERNSEFYYQAFLEPYGGGDFFRRWYSFDVEDLHVIILDSCIVPGTGLYELQKEWLEKDLKESQGKFIIVVFHYPFFTNTPNREPSYKEDWEKLFIKYGVKVVFNGHLHHYERFYKDGVMYVTTGGGGAPLGFGLKSSQRRYLPWTESGEAGYLHYVIAEVKEDKVVFTVRAVAKYDWGNLERLDEVIDSFVIEK